MLVPIARRLPLPIALNESGYEVLMVLKFQEFLFHEESAMGV
jgi:hypothetical protein